MISQTAHIDNASFPEEISSHEVDPFSVIQISLFSGIDGVIYRWVLFHLLFLFLLTTEFLCLYSFIFSLLHSSLFALTLASFFFTLFTFLVLRLYLLSRKSQQFFQWKEQYLLDCKEKIRFREEILEHHISLAHLCEKAAIHLQGKEDRYYLPPRWMNLLSSPLEKISRWLHAKDIFSLQELFLQAAIHEHMSVIKRKPTRLESHANLANAYVLLSGLYAPPSDDEESDFFSRQSKKMRTECAEKFRETAQKAIEELTILNDYAPNDPWVHAQLAYSYRDLQMPIEEIREYETIYRLRPEDKETLYRLGVLYFQQGYNAKGLQVYEELQRSHYQKAKQLISYYGRSRSYIEIE